MDKVEYIAMYNNDKHINKIISEIIHEYSEVQYLRLEILNFFFSRRAFKI